MECGCIYVDASDSQASFHRESVVKARKTHRCTECGRDIPAGEEYEYVFGVWDGDPSTYKTCRDCLSLRSSFFCDGWFYTRVLGDLGEHIGNMEGRIGEECIVPLTPRAQDMVFAAIEEIWHEMDLDEEVENG
jgi:hypothetical protein